MARRKSRTLDSPPGAADPDSTPTLTVAFDSWVVPYRARRKQLVAERYTELCENLRRAAWVFSNELGGQQEGARLACRYVAHFLHETGASPVTSIPLLGVMKAFEDLQKGVMPTLFSRDQEPKERGRDSRTHWNKTWAAVLLEYALEKNGADLKQTAGNIARAANKWPAFAAQQITWSTIRDWRKSFKSDLSGDGADFKRLSELLGSDLNADEIIKDIMEKGPQ